jgi:hypothetical protein
MALVDWGMPREDGKEGLRGEGGWMRREWMREVWRKGEETGRRS